MDKLLETKHDVIPRWFLYTMGFWVIGSLFFVFFSVFTDRPRVGVPIPSEIEEAVPISFRKLEDGSISIFDKNNKEILNSMDGYSGFIAVILKALERDRKKNNIKLETQYSLELYKHKSGRISVLDIDTEWSLNITSFGKMNAGIFLPMFKKSKGEK